MKVRKEREKMRNAGGKRVGMRKRMEGVCE
jgi:hypothetical protein